MKAIEYVDEEYKKHQMEPVIEAVADILGDLPLMQAELLVLSEDALEMPSNITVENKKLAQETNAVMFIGANLLQRPEVSNLPSSFHVIKKFCCVKYMIDEKQARSV